MADLIHRVGRESRERSSIIVHTLAAQSRSGLGRTGQGWSAVGLGCAILYKTHPCLSYDFVQILHEDILHSYSTGGKGFTFGDG